MKQRNTKIKNVYVATHEPLFLVFKLRKPRNQRIKNVYVAAYEPPFSIYLKKRSTKSEICRLTFIDLKYSIFFNISISHCS